ncbi:MAG: recombinase family protein, partial [Oscillospiraceae bacterium]|nr:recombinase family protein [Oscillospiraceae bacterium]
MKVFGYCRISTKRQSIERQVENICKAYNSAEIFTETFTGSTLDRPQWQKLKQKALKLALNGENVTIVF